MSRAGASIRRRLAAGVALSTLVFALVAGWAHVALGAAGARTGGALAASAREYDHAQRITAALLDEAAGVALVGELSGEARHRARARYRARGAELDSLRLAATAGPLATLSGSQRAELEAVGRLQSVLEVRLAVAQAHQALGRPAAARAALDAAAADLAQLDPVIDGYRAGTAARAAGVAAAVQADARRTSEAIAALSALAVVLAAAGGVAAARAVVRPLGALVRHAEALGRGDFAARTGAAGLPGEFALLAGTLNRAGEALGVLEARLSHQAHHDALTGLANRARFHERARAAVAAACAAGTPGRVAVLVVDLDGFKGVNDRLGHAAGDALLVAVAGRLLGATRGSDVVARFGGDEFALLLDPVRPGADGEADAATVAERVVRALEAPVAVRDGRDATHDAGASHVATVGASVGIARLAPGAPADADAGAAVDGLLRAADGAMYAAKRAGKGRWAAAEVTGGPAGAPATGTAPATSPPSAPRPTAPARPPRPTPAPGRAPGAGAARR